MTELIRFDPAMAGEPAAPSAERLLRGDPRQLIANQFTDATGQFFAGRWSSTRGRWRVSYAENEFCHLLQGRIRIESASGEVNEFGPGESFVIPAGFAGIWEVLEDCEKLYAIFESRERSPPSPSGSGGTEGERGAS